MPPGRPRSSPPWTIGGVPVHLRRSARRRTLALQVRPGEVVLYAPLRTPEATLSAFVEARRDWAERHLRTFAARQPFPAQWQDGSPYPFLGEALTVRLVAGVRLPERAGNELRLPPGPDLAASLEAWSRREALPIFRGWVEEYAGALEARDRLGRVGLSGARTRWGSCSSRGDIRLHWALSRAPHEVARYVALHEAAHLLEFNHSPRYWAHVSRLMPEHARWRAWLRGHGQTLLTR
ncbi:SprT family zinc-dependent metalloprotease [Deinococcus sp. MIMF12]|uniref:SprT family zinc-dependent metalloprotease n=1 Tax=Deinococcus rhizophilus TaxID=3049544 RepID=A0ABT7JGP7_9DEIO|nr:SprT family zinc-dependent metalloprotease [Deinococcus rhizophilus]MDL2344212.1 SprT family zinc-dependent metalloprotease [Deinococcus rhizophilus]